MTRPTMTGDLALLGITQQALEGEIATVPPSVDVWAERNRVLQALLKDAHLVAVLKYHPDRNPDPEALEKTQAINAAYDRLSKVRIQPPPQPVRIIPMFVPTFTATSTTTTTTTTSYVHVKFC